jgi:hypothetical protein
VAELAVADLATHSDRTRRPYLVAPGGSTQAVQAAAEGVVLHEDPNLVEFMGQRFRLAERIGLMPMLAFANASKQGLDSDDMDGLAAMYALIRDVVDQTRVQKTDPGTGEPLADEAGEPEWEGPSQWQLFEKHAIDTQADGDDLMEFVSAAMAVVASRPRKRREPSSGSSPRTSEKSKDVSSSPGMPAGVEGLVPVATLGR